MSDRDSDIGAFLAGFVVGGLVGAVGRCCCSLLNPARKHAR